MKDKNSLLPYNDILCFSYFQKSEYSYFSGGYQCKGVVVSINLVHVIQLFVAA